MEKCRNTQEKPRSKTGGTPATRPNQPPQPNIRTSCSPPNGGKRAPRRKAGPGITRANRARITRQASGEKAGPGEESQSGGRRSTADYPSPVVKRHAPHNLVFKSTANPCGRGRVVQDSLPSALRQPGSETGKEMVSGSDKEKFGEQSVDGNKKPQLERSSRGWCGSEPYKGGSLEGMIYCIINSSVC